eukprot:5682946-Prymnesium_polylepis.1
MERVGRQVAFSPPVFAGPRPPAPRRRLPQRHRKADPAPRFIGSALAPETAERTVSSTRRYASSGMRCGI